MKNSSILYGENYCWDHFVVSMNSICDGHCGRFMMKASEVTPVKKAANRSLTAICQPRFIATKGTRQFAHRNTAKTKGMLAQMIGAGSDGPCSASCHQAVMTTPATPMFLNKIIIF